MRYAYQDLGEQPRGTTVVVRWTSSAANAILLDPVNFTRYVERWPFVYHGGGRYQDSPAHLSIPQDGRWFVVVDIGRYVAEIAPIVEVVAPADSRPRGARQAGGGLGLNSPADGAPSSPGLSPSGV